MVQPAVVKIAMYNVHCPECDEMIIAPDTQFDRTGWVESELQPGTIAYCTNVKACGTAKRRVPLVIPMVAGMVVELALA